MKYCCLAGLGLSLTFSALAKADENAPSYGLKPQLLQDVPRMQKPFADLAKTTSAGEVNRAPADDQTLMRTRNRPWYTHA